MVHEVQRWDSDSDWADEDDQDELDQDTLMNIQDRVKPPELKEMTVADICGTSPSFQLSQRFKKLTPGRAYMRWPDRLEPRVSTR